MARPRYQDGSLFIRGKRIKVWAARWREDVIREDGTLHRTQPTVLLGALSELSRREARSLLQRRVSEINQGRHGARPMITFERFSIEHWEAGALLAPKPSNSRFYKFNLDWYILPAIGAHRFCDGFKEVAGASRLPSVQKHSNENAEDPRRARIDLRSDHPGTGGLEKHIKIYKEV
jgi:hypothetical protein